MPASARRCPTCLARLTPWSVTWRDAGGAVSAGPPHRRTALDRFRGRLDRAPDRSAQEWADWYARGFRAYCPDHQCPLPDDFFTRDLVLIGLVGESGSSKTHYLAALLHLLSRGALAPYDVIVDLEQSTVLRYQNEYYQRLFVERQVIGATRPLVWLDAQSGQRETRAPLTIVLRNWQTGGSVNVCLFDAAGEQLLTRQDQAAWTRHLSIADGLMFFVDPSVLPGVRERLGHLDGAGQTLHVTESVIEVTSGLARMGRDLPPDADLSSVPAALLLAKADLLAGTDGFPAAALDPLDHLGDAPYRLANRLAQDSLLVEEYLIANGGTNLVHSAVHKFPGITFHAVSATGCAPQDNAYASIDPQRCLEPFVHLLARTGLIDLERANG